MTRTALQESAGSGKAGRAGRMATVQSAARTVGIIKALLHSPKGASLTELSDGLSLHKTTVLRLLRTLEAEAVLERDRDSGRYRPTSRFWLTIAMAFGDVQSIKDGVRELLTGLAERTGATAVLALPDEDQRRMVVVMYALASQPLLVDPGRVRVGPMHAASGGKCYLASLPEAELQAWVRCGLPKVTRNTTTSRQKLLQEIGAVRRRGYAFSREELVPGCSGLAVSLRDDRSQVIGSLELVVPAPRLTQRNMQRWLPVLRETAERLSALVRHASLGRDEGAQGSAPML